MKVTFLVLALFFSLLAGGSLIAQTYSDTTLIYSDSSVTIEAPKEVKKGSIFKGRPGKSMIYSLIIPGSGQWYNGSILRAHGAWAAVGGAGYAMIYFTREYRCLKEAYIHKIDGTPFTPTKCSKALIHNIPLYRDAATIRVQRDKANKNKQTAIIGFGFVWLLNGVDAFVDAHLKDFDIDEDLSFKVETRMENDPNAPMKLGLYVQF